MDSAVDARSEEACGYRGQKGVLVTSETTIRLRQATEGGLRRDRRAGATRATVRDRRRREQLRFEAHLRRRPRSRELRR